MSEPLRLGANFGWTPRQKELFRFISQTQDALVYGGAGGGKTFGTVGAVAARALKAPESTHLIVRQRFNHAKNSIGRQSLPEVLRSAYRGVRVETNLSEGIFKLITNHGASEIWLGGLDDQARMEKILGTKFATIYENEVSQISYEGHTMLATRLRQEVQTIDGGMLKVRRISDLNPGPISHWTYQLFHEQIDPDERSPLPETALAKMGVFTMSPMDNEANLPADYIQSLRDLPQRQRRRFFEGAYQADMEGALWRRGTIGRLLACPDRDKIQRIVVALDPAVSSHPGSNETGVIVAGIDTQGRGLVLDDDSGVYTPEEWARRAVGLYRKWSADCIVYEENQGGEMVASTIRAQMPNAPLQGVRATRGKWVRAEPIAALYELEKVYHIGVFDRLEDQMCSFTPDFDRKAAGFSPDRVDALVWALTALFPDVVQRSNVAPPKRYRPPEHLRSDWNPFEAV